MSLLKMEATMPKTLDVIDAVGIVHTAVDSNATLYEIADKIRKAVAHRRSYCLLYGNHEESISWTLNKPTPTSVESFAAIQEECSSVKISFFTDGRYLQAQYEDDQYSEVKSMDLKEPTDQPALGVKGAFPALVAAQKKYPNIIDLFKNMTPLSICPEVGVYFIGIELGPYMNQL